MDSSEGAEPSEKKFVFPPAPRSIKKRGRLLRPRPLAADNCQLGGRFFPHFFVFAFPMPPPCPFLFKETINGFELSTGPTTMDAKFYSEEAYQIIPIKAEMRKSGWLQPPD